MVSKNKGRRCRGSNPGRPRDRREYSPLYYNELVAVEAILAVLLSIFSQMDYSADVSERQLRVYWLETGICSTARFHLLVADASLGGSWDAVSVHEPILQSQK